LKNPDVSRYQLMRRMRGDESRHHKAVKGRTFHFLPLPHQRAQSADGDAERFDAATAP
jgi:hypothetical protein